MKYTQSPDNRKGDHICYISDLTKLRRDYPEWDVRIPLREIVSQMIAAEVRRVEATSA